MMQADSRWARVGRVAGAALTVLALVAVVGVTIEGNPQVGTTAPAPQAPGGRGLTTFPAQQRPPADPALVARGKQVYGLYCRACHGEDLRGGDMGGPNLLRSDVMLNDLDGEALAPIVRGSRATSGMAAVDLSADDIKAVAAHIHAVLATSRGQGAPPAGPAMQLNVLVGDAAAGEAYFKAHCASCHSASGDLQGIATRVSDPMALQNLWVGGGRPAGRGVDADSLSPRRAVTVTVAPPSGPAVQGRLERIDDFTVTVVLADGTRRTFRRVGDVPRVDVNDPLAAHRRLLETYANRDIHNVTAYLVTLK